jgi:DNA-binding response OmpR family regulator
MNGRQLSEAVRRARPGLPVLLVTGFAGSALENMAPEAGIEVIFKPFALEALAARIAAIREASLVR